MPKAHYLDRSLRAIRKRNILGLRSIELAIRGAEMILFGYLQPLSSEAAEAILSEICLSSSQL